MNISKVLSVGDMVFSAQNGEPIKVTNIYSCGISTKLGYFSFDEHRKKFWLTKRCYLDSIKRSDNNAE